MQKYNIEVGDRVTFENLEGNKVVTIIKDDIDMQNTKEALETRKILKIERPKYEVIEEKKELLTEEEKELLQVMIKNLHTHIKHIKKSGDKIILIKNNNEEVAQIIISDTILYFNNLEYRKTYSLSELGLEK